jgi:hypothetical protein
VTKRVKLVGVSALAFISAGLMAASALAQGPTGGTDTAPTATTAPTTPPTTETAPTTAPAATTAPSATTAPTTTQTTPPPPSTSTTTTTETPPPAAAASTDDAAEVPSFFSSRYTPEKDKASKETPTASWRWAGTEYFQQIGFTPNAFSPGLTQSPDVLVDTFLLFQPRYAITKNWQLRLRITASYEFTDNSLSTTTRANEFDFGDMLPQIAYLGIPKFWGIKTSVGLGVGLPTSPASQERTMYANPFLTVSLSKTFENVLKADWSIALLGTFSHPIYQYTTGGLNNQPQYEPACFGAGDSGCGLQATGAANTENGLNVGANLSAQWGKFGVSLYYLLINQWVYQFSTLPGVEQEPGGSVPFRQLSYFDAEIGWDFTSYFTASLGYQMYRSMLTGESTYGNPFWDPYQDQRLYAAVTFHLDKLYDALRGVKDKETHVDVRRVTQNGGGPTPSL